MNVVVAHNRVLNLRYSKYFNYTCDLIYIRAQFFFLYSARMY